MRHITIHGLKTNWEYNPIYPDDKIIEYNGELYDLPNGWDGHHCSEYEIYYFHQYLIYYPEESKEYLLDNVFDKQDVEYIRNHI